MVNTILARRVNHIVAKGDNPVWPKGSKSRGFSKYITDMQKVMEYGVMSMPALVVNEKVVAMGKVLKAADVVALLHKLGF